MKKIPRSKCLFCNKDCEYLYTTTFLCSNECRRAKFISDWLEGNADGGRKYGEISDIIRDYLFKINDSKCVQCGWSKIHPITNKVPLHIDHIDGNWQDSSFNNLRLLCPNCHSLTEHWGSLNKGMGRRRAFRDCSSVG